MKKYVKPDLYVESFELSKHVANCAWEVGSDGKANADSQMGFSGYTLFTIALGCDLTTDTEGGNFKDYCYTTGSSDMNVYCS